MRIALVSPYSWTYPGGVTRHIEALAEQFLATGHDVRVLAPFDPDDPTSGRLHRGARPQDRPLPEWLIPLGRTVGIPANGAVSSLSASPSAVAKLRHELYTGGFDVVHVHEPVAPPIGWDAVNATRLPLVGTFHCYSENRISNNIANLVGARRTLNKLHVRIAVSEAAAWTGRRFFGGRYRIIPNGVDLAAAAATEKVDAGHLRIVFVGQAVERKGLPVLLRAFEALRDHVPATLTIVGATAEEVEPLALDPRGVTVLGRASDEEKWAALREADVLCAPSLGGESFGMVLTEAFAAGTPVIASDIAGYRDVVRHGDDGLLVPCGDAQALAEELRGLAIDPARRRCLAAGARRAAPRYAWPRIAQDVLHAYEDAISMPVPETAVRRAAARVGALPADGLPHRPAVRLPTMEPKPAGRVGLAALRKVGVAVALLLGIALGAGQLERMGIRNIGHSLLASSPTWVLVGLGLMCSSMILRALSWHAILKAALPGARVKRGDAMQGTFIGVLMSATLPARLGEPSRALIVARRLGRMRERFPVVLGTLVSQTLLNVVALVILGTVMFATVGLFAGHQGALVAFTIAPLVIVLLVLSAPALLRRGAPTRHARMAAWVAEARGALHQVRHGLEVFRHPRLGLAAATAQLGAWGIQWLSCFVLLVALGLDDRAGIGAAAAVLFAVNVTAVLPVVPSNLGVFQAACVAVLTNAYGVSAADALAYGIILQAVEIATAVIMGMPALLREGLSWRDVRMRTLHASPVSLPARQSTSAFELEA